MPRVQHPKSAAASRSNRGSALESVVIASQCGLIRVEKMPTGSRFVKGVGWIPVKGPVDYVGTVIANRRSIVFDAKECALLTRYNVGNKDHLRKHQREYLIRQGQAGAISGVLVQATHPRVAAYFWLPWEALLVHEPSIKWDDPRLIRLGPSSRSIPFGMVPGVRGERRSFDAALDKANQKFGGALRRLAGGPPQVGEREA